MVFKGALALLIGMALFTVAKASHANRGEDFSARVWFYDQSKCQLYAAPRNLIPPEGDGEVRVRAMVVGFRGMGNKVGELKIAYLEKYSPEYKALLTRAEIARAASHPFLEILPSPDSEYHRQNTFVKRRAESSWHSLESDEAREIMSEWRSWRGPAGQLPIISVPSDVIKSG